MFNTATSASSSSSASSSARNAGPPSNLAKQYDADKERLVKSCFSKVDEQNQLLESYITHVRIVEDAKYPSSRPPPSSSGSNKKHRIIIVAVRKSGRVRVHKARENPDGTFQIGKTWNLDDLTCIEGDTVNPNGLVMHMGKPYYWVTGTPKEKSVFLGSVIKIYTKYTGGRSPEVINNDSQAKVAPPGAAGATGAAAALATAPAVSTSPPSTVRQIPLGSVSRNGPPSPSLPNGLSSLRNVTTASPSVVPPLRVSGVSSTSSSSVTSAPAATLTPITDPMKMSNERPPMANAHPPLSPPGRSSPRIDMHLSQSPVPSQKPTFDRIPSPQQQQHLVPVSSSPVSDLPIRTKQPPSQNKSVGFATTPPIEIPRQRPRQPQSRSPVTAQAPFSQRPPMAVAPEPITTPSPPAIVIDQSPDTQDSFYIKPQTDDNNSFVLREEPSITVKRRQRHSVSFDTQEIPSSSEQNKDSDLNGHRRNDSSVNGVRIFTHQSDIDSTKSSIDDVAAAGGLGIEKYELHESIPTSESPPKLPLAMGKKAKRRSIVSTASRHSFNRMRLSSSHASAVVDILDEFNWNGRDDSENLELNITNELSQIEAANLHNVVDLDDRLDELDKSLESAINECEQLDTMLAFFAVQLGSFGDDIFHIESQGQGLQVQTTNQKILWNELHGVLHTVSLPDEILQTLRSGRFESIDDVATTEIALMELYGSLRAVRMSGGQNNGDNNSNKNNNNSEFLGTMRALNEKKHIFEQTATEFSTRFRLFADFKFQNALQLAENEVAKRDPDVEEPSLNSIEVSFMKNSSPLSGILLFLKEIDQMTYTAVLTSYEGLIKPYYQSEISNYFAKWRRSLAPALNKQQKLMFYSQENVSNEGAVAKSLKRTATLGGRLKADSVKGSGSPTTTLNGNDSRHSFFSFDSSLRTPIKRALKKIVDNLTTIVISQQEVLIRLFHQSSFAAQGYIGFVKEYPVYKRMDEVDEFLKVLSVREIDSDRLKAQEMLNILGSIFSHLHEDISKFVDFLVKSDNLGCLYLLALLEVNISKFETTNQDFLLQLLQRSKDKVVAVWNKYVNDQIRTIETTLVSSKKRKGVIYFVKVLPNFCQLIESDLKDTSITENCAIADLPVRKLVDESYEKVSKAIFHNLQRIAKEPSATTTSTPAVANSQNNNADYEDKEKLNYHILMVENMNVLIEGLEDEIENNFTLQNIRLTALATYRKELNLYIQTVIHRPLGKLLEFVNGVEAILAKTPSENPAVRHGYSKAHLKRVLTGFDAKELRKNVDALNKRVEKHFLGDEFDKSVDRGNGRIMVNKVWSALQAEFSSFYGRLLTIIEQYYSDSSDRETGMVEFTKQDVMQAFARE